MAWRAFALDTLPDEPWRNGGGRTRTIAAQAREADALGASTAESPPWDWRLSVATIERSGPFSAFPGVDRCSLLLGPGRIELSAAGEPTRRLMQPGDGVDYAGDPAWQATVLRDGPPLSLLNVMTRRGAVMARVHAVRDDTTLSGTAIAVFAVEGDWRVADTSSDGNPPHVLAAGHGVVGDAASPPFAPLPSAPMRWRIERVSTIGWLAAVTIDAN